jgi:hypothetical protein
MAVTIKLRRDTASNWTSNNPTLAEGEPGFETDTGKIKYGDGLTAWNSLDYAVYEDTSVDTHLNTSSAGSNQVLSWSGSDYTWVTQSSGSSSSGGNANIEWFKLNYTTTGLLDSISDTTSGVSASIISTTGGDVEITFSGYSYPPSNILIYGYSRATNEYVIMPLNKDITTRKIAGGGTAGSPTVHGSMGSLTLTLKLREAETGASRSFGTPTHAWIHFMLYG